MKSCIDRSRILDILTQLHSSLVIVFIFISPILHDIIFKYYAISPISLLFCTAIKRRRIVVGVTGFKLTISMCSLIR